ncbi:MAG: UDP-2,4-diacetamido-2,4,6-trideoxy-beta-L-altropyranose hydrolase [Candidatus Rokubacteria bacterium]|nr:UDP-2,4-diacetamido-2,4,6-trideoxy-beta-L-altropyranose hydrolase [Candidatus Rokubacteria bacterium]
MTGDRLLEQSRRVAAEAEAAGLTRNGIAFRVDADSRIGVGHLMRSLALAEACVERGSCATIITACRSATLLERIRARGADVVSLTEADLRDGGLARTAESVRGGRHGWVVLDGYDFGPAYQRGLRRSTPARLLVIDDYAHHPSYDADVLLNQNVFAEQLEYRCAPDTVRLLGPRHALLRREFRADPPPARDVASVGRRILVTLGGADPEQVTLTVVRALDLVDLPNLEATILMGPVSRHVETVRLAAEASRRAGRRGFTVLHDVVDPRPLMATADVAITAGGSTCWELAYLGVPIAAVTVAENQRRIAAGLERLGVAVDLGWFRALEVGTIATQLGALLRNGPRRAEMSARGRAVVDGRGTDRVLAALGAGPPARVAQRRGS